MTKHEYEIGDKVIWGNVTRTVIGIIDEYAVTTGMIHCDLILDEGLRVAQHLVRPINKGQQMINKQEAKQQLEKLEAEVQKLKEIINKPENVGSLLEEFGDYLLSNDSGKLFAIEVRHAHRIGINRFPSEDIAQSYAEAFNTMLALRKCEGSVSSVDGEEQYYIAVDPSSDGLAVYGRTSNFAKLDMISPMFSTKGYAQLAIDKVGKDNILKMSKTLHGIYY